MREVEGQGTGLTEKEVIRESVWQLMERAGVARFPGTRGRIPNFVGAEAAARLLAGHPQWKQATRIKANPDAPQLPVRYQALKDGKTVYMAVPRLREEKCFIELDPGKIGASLRSAASIKGAFRYGRSVSLGEVQGVDLIVCGSVAVNREGARVGKGGGFSDLEYALLLEWGAITYDTPIATTVHPLQIIDNQVSMLPHDIPVSLIVTPEKIIKVDPIYPSPKGLYWEYLSPEKIEAIPAVRSLQDTLA